MTDGAFVITNPRNIHATSLLEVDRQWINDFDRYMHTLRFYEDQEEG